MSVSAQNVLPVWPERKLGIMCDPNRSVDPVSQSFFGVLFKPFFFLFFFLENSVISFKVDSLLADKF